VNRPLVSIGMPVFNGFPFLPQALESLLAQDYPNFELVISDNGSADQTGAYCQDLARRDPRIRYVRNDTNIGPMANFRQAVNLAKGEFFMWGADDDLWSKQYVSTLVKRLEEHPEAVLATPSFQPIRDDGSLLSWRRPAICRRGKSAQAWQLFRDVSATWLYGLYRREKLLPWAERWQGAFYGDFDSVWLLKMILNEQVVGDDRAIMYKRHNRRGTGRSGAFRQRATGWGMVFRNAAEACREAPLPASVRHACCAAVWTAFGLRCARYLLFAAPRDALKRAVGWKRRPVVSQAEFLGAESKSRPAASRAA
jgi:glycosyltransferase involved in cell wall biosynthesis